MSIDFVYICMCVLSVAHATRREMADRGGERGGLRDMKGRGTQSEREREKERQTGNACSLGRCFVLRLLFIINDCSHIPSIVSTH